MKPAPHNTFSKPAIAVIAVILSFFLLGDSAAQAYQFPAKARNRMYRIFVPVQKITNPKSSTTAKTPATKSLVIASNTKALHIADFRKFRFDETKTETETDTVHREHKSVVVTVTPSWSQPSMRFGDTTSISASCAADPSGILPSAPVVAAPFITPTTPVGIYNATCSVAVSTGSVVIGADTDDFTVVIGAPAVFEVKEAPVSPALTDVNVSPTVSPSSWKIGTNWIEPIYSYSSKLAEGIATDPTCGPETPINSSLHAGSSVTVTCAGGTAKPGYRLNISGSASFTVIEADPPSGGDGRGCGICWVPDNQPTVPTVDVIPAPTLPQVARPIIVTTKPVVKKASKKRFARSASMNSRIATFAKFSNITGKPSLVKIPHDPGTKIQLTPGVEDSLRTRLKLEITDEGVIFTAVNGWTGRIAVPVVVTQDGVLVELYIGIVENPGPVLLPKFYLDDLQSATIKWQPDNSQVVFYNVYVGSKLLCTTPKTMCTQVESLNTHADLTIEAVGHQQTFSTMMSPKYTATKLIPAKVVHFATGSSVLSVYDRSLLDDLVMAAKNLGLNTIYITGHTDSTGSAALNKPLSAARSVSVKSYIAKFFPGVKIVNRGFSSTEPVATNATVTGRENNRRAEVSVG